MALQAVVFDVDGTLLDSVDAHAKAWQDTFRHFGLDFPYEKLRHNVGKGSDQYLQAFLPPDEAERHHDEMVELRLAVFKRDYLPGLRPFRSVRELMKRIREADLKVALATSAKGDELESYFKLLDVEDLLDGHTTSDDAEKSKPHPDIFEAALEQIAVEPEAAVIVGDTPYDAQAAVSAGSRVIGVLCGGFAEAELREAGCSRIYRDPEDLLRRFHEWAN